jgi:hypothetical protein
MCIWPNLLAVAELRLSRASKGKLFNVSDRHYVLVSAVIEVMRLLG